MKEMIALEILKTLLEDHTYDHIVSYDASMKEVKEAIAELKALQSRSCEGCKNLVETGKSFKHCDELAINISHMDCGSFCCNRYEAKEQL